VNAALESLETDWIFKLVSARRLVIRYWWYYFVIYSAGITCWHVWNNVCKVAGMLAVVCSLPLFTAHFVFIVCYVHLDWFSFLFSVPFKAMGLLKDRIFLGWFILGFSWVLFSTGKEIWPELCQSRFLWGFFEFCL